MTQQRVMRNDSHLRIEPAAPGRRAIDREFVRALAVDLAGRTEKLAHGAARVRAVFAALDRPYLERVDASGTPDRVESRIAAAVSRRLGLL